MMISLFGPPKLGIQVVSNKVLLMSRMRGLLSDTLLLGKCGMVQAIHVKVSGFFLSKVFLANVSLNKIF